MIIKSTELNKRRSIRNRYRLKRNSSMYPRLSVYRSNLNIYVQVIDDTKGMTLVSASSMDKEIKKEIKYGGNVDAAKVVGITIAKKALKAGIEKVVFDRGGFLYHGRIKALAESARENGLKF